MQIARSCRQFVSSYHHFEHCYNNTRHLSNYYNSKSHCRHFTTSRCRDNDTHFGYQTIPEAEKEEKVKEVFEKVANSYDLMNDAMSFGIHRVWKDCFVKQAAPQPNFKCLDVAGGTGDIAFRLLRHMRNINTDHENIVICDINSEMLKVGLGRAEELGINKNCVWLEGNAEQLDLPDSTFDLYTIAYGIRNVTHIDRVLSEAYRVLKPGGKFMCLEFSDVPNPVISEVYDRYSFDVIPVLGQLIAGDFESYQYLVESIRKFPKQEEFAGMIAEAGFCVVGYENLTFGVTAIHSGFKL